MSAVATAIIGSAVVGGVVADRSSKAAAKAAERGAGAAADATLEATRLQIDELGRQFDYQMEVLYPQIQQQYNAQGAFGDLMGITADNPAPSVPDYVATYEDESRQRQQEIGILQQYRDELQNELDQGVQLGGGVRGATATAARQAELQRQIADYDREIAEINNRPFRRDEWMANAMRDRPPQGRNDNFRPQRDASGAFIDPNLSQRQLADESRYAEGVRNNLLAPTGPEQDLYAQHVAQNQLGDVGQQLVDRAGNVVQLDQVRNNLLEGRTAYGDDALVARTRDDTIRGAMGTLEDDPLQRRIEGTADVASDFARGTEIVGGEFTESPGYAFAREEMQRELDRKRSAGGNFGGRAIMEAQRRAAGLANQEFYNYANIRGQELARQDTALRYDVGRGDEAVRGFTNREFQAILADAQRGDEAARRFLEEQAGFARTDAARMDAASQFDIGRGDQALNALVNYQAADVGRGDVAFEDYMRRREGDVTRMDQANQYVDQLSQYDLQRQDQGYYNYLNNLRAAAGFGGGAQAQAVQASQAQGGQIANVYGSQGSQLSSIYGGLGRTNAAIAYDRGANINNALQSGVQNYFTHQYLSRPTPAAA